MKLTDIPKLMPVPFGVNGNRSELLPASPAGDRSASYADGFPPITMLLKSAGGLPPKGEDMNQILFELASGIRWINTGAGYAFNKVFCDAVGGYPKGAKLASNDGKKIYISTKNDNTTDFNVTPGTDWVTLTDFLGVDGKLDKTDVLQTTGTSTTAVISQDGTTKAIKNAVDGIVIPEVPDATTKTKGIVRLDDKVTKDSVNVPTSGAVYDAVNGLLKPGFTMLTMLDEADIAPPWYLINGDRYGIGTPQGKVLRALSADLKARWNIVETSQTVTLPTVLQPDGRMPFPRPVNGTSRKTGSVIGDAIRNINGEIGYDSQYGLTTSDNDVTGAFYRYGPSKKALSGSGGTGQTTNIAFSAANVVPTASENKPLDVGVTWIVFLGV